mgnify:CR=1 FL=1
MRPKIIVSSNSFNLKLIMEINNIGANAGLIWNALNANGKMTESKLKKETGLGSAEFYTALGWLAREGKLNVTVETRCGKDCEYLTLA